MEERPQFRVELVRAEEGTAVIALEGEVDIYSAPQFKEALLAGIDDGATTIIVDLGRVTFIDSTALGVLVSGAKRVRPKNGRVDIVCTDENITRIFEITGLDRIFGIYRTRADALKAAAASGAE
jgi:anti-sigma B factor antagonist